jgi:hypothetical protein
MGWITIIMGDWIMNGMNSETKWNGSPDFREGEMNGSE